MDSSGTASDAWDALYPSFSKVPYEWQFIKSSWKSRPICPMCPDSLGCLGSRIRAGIEVGPCPALREGASGNSSQRGAHTFLHPNGVASGASRSDRSSLTPVLKASEVVRQLPKVVDAAFGDSLRKPFSGHSPSTRSPTASAKWALHGEPQCSFLRAFHT